MTEDQNAAERRSIARTAALTCFITLTVFGLSGTMLFRLFGITLPAFKIAGGVLLIWTAKDMLQARQSPTKEVAEEREEGCQKSEIGTIPLGLPMLAGPGSLSTVMVLVGQSPSWWHTLPVFTAILVTSLSCYWVLAGAERVRGYLGETGIRVLMRLMGLVLMAVAIQFVISALADLNLVARPVLP
jgi:multiple antibiotic resistance protein